MQASQDHCRVARQVWGEQDSKVPDGMRILEAIYDDPTTPQWLKKIPAIETLRIAWVHQYWIDNGELHWRSHKDLPPAGIRSNSPYDLKARYGNKRHTTWLGYKVHLTETCEKNQIHLITNVQTTEAHLSDVDQTESIHQCLADKDLLPSQHIVDSDYVDGALLVRSKQQHDLELIGPIRENVSWQSKIPDGYDLSKFKINWKNQRVTYPQGVKSTKKWTPLVDQWGNEIIRRMTTIRELKGHIDLKPLSWLVLDFVFFTTTSQKTKN